MTLKEQLLETQKLLTKIAEFDFIVSVEKAIEVIVASLLKGRPLLVCGNGGSAADALHIAGELVGRFKKERPALKVISLTADSSILTAISNDYSYNEVFARQVEAYGEKGSVLLGISPSDASQNVIEALTKAKEQEMTTIVLTGKGGGEMAAIADVAITVPSDSTPRIQEAHLCLYHYICEKVEERMIEQSAKLNPINVEQMSG